MPVIKRRLQHRHLLKRLRQLQNRNRPRDGSWTTRMRFSRANFTTWRFLNTKNISRPTQGHRDALMLTFHSANAIETSDDPETRPLISKKCTMLMEIAISPVRPPTHSPRWR